MPTRIEPHMSLLRPHWVNPSAHAIAQIDTPPAPADLPPISPSTISTPELMQLYGYSRTDIARVSMRRSLLPLGQALIDGHWTHIWDRSLIPRFARAPLGAPGAPIHHSLTLPAPSASDPEGPSPLASPPPHANLSGMTTPDIAILLSTERVAAHWNVTPSRIRQIVMQSGIKPHLVIGGAHLWHPSQLATLCPRSSPMAQTGNAPARVTSRRSAPTRRRTN